MRLISTEHGQSFQRFIGDELRPLSGLYVPDMLRAITERYAFGFAPALADALKDGAKFREGRMTQDGATIAIKELGIYNDGALVFSWNTDDAEAVVNDLLRWLTSDFGLREPTTLFPRRLSSSVTVEFHDSIDGAFQAFRAFTNEYAALLSKLYGWQFPLEAARLTFGSDLTTMPQFTNADFIIERRQGVPFTANRYFSSAPLPTSDHLKLLELFESVIGD